jgi:hypothetical protein
MNQNKFETIRNECNRVFDIRGSIRFEDIALNPVDAARRVQEELVRSVVERIMEKLGPKIDEAIYNTFKEENE